MTILLMLRKITLLSVPTLLFTFFQANASQKPDQVDIPDHALVVCNARIPGTITDKASFGHRPGPMDFFHLNLAKKVTSIDLDDNHITNSLKKDPSFLGMSKGFHAHITADARAHQFPPHTFDLIFMELPPSYNQKVDIELRINEYNSGALGAYTGLIPQMIRNLSPSLKPGGTLQIEHLSYMELLDHRKSPILGPNELLSHCSSALLADLTKRDPFTLFYSGYYYLISTFSGILSGNQLTQMLLNEDSYRALLDSYVTDHLVSILRQSHAHDPLLIEEHQKRARSDVSIMAFLPRAIKIRADFEGCKPEKIAEVVANEFRTITYTQLDSYTFLLNVYCHMLYLWKNMHLIDDILEPLGFEKAKVVTKRKSHNGRPYAWFIQARKKEGTANNS